MSFTVIWSPGAFESIAEIYDASSHPEDVLSAVRNIDRQLSRDPAQEGESRPFGRRITFAPPLGALFEVHWRLEEVVVAVVWAFQQHET